MVKTVFQQLGPVGATLFQQLFHLAIAKQPCDICLKNGRIFTDATVGADFAYALEFEAPVQTVFEMLSEIKVVTGIMTPVIRISLDDVNAVISMPKKGIAKAEIDSLAAKVSLTERDSRGETLEAFIRKTYQPKTKNKLKHYAARYLLALQWKKSHGH
jgi:hypothetical protein